MKPFTANQVAAYARTRRVKAAERLRNPWTPEQEEARRKNAMRSAFSGRCKRLGVTVEDVARALKAQDYSCAICRYWFTEDSWEMDHCHRTGKFRGLLCRICNGALGAFRDNLTEMANFFMRFDVVVAYLKPPDGKGAHSVMLHTSPPGTGPEAGGLSPRWR